MLLFIGPKTNNFFNDTYCGGLVSVIIKWQRMTISCSEGPNVDDPLRFYSLIGHGHAQ